MTSLLPPNKSTLESTVESVISRIDAIDVPLRTLIDPYSCPADILPWLAWALAVDYWDNKWSDKQKRDIIANSISLHKTKGTIGGVENAVAALGYDVKISEWFEANKAPGTFGLTIELDENQNLYGATDIINTVNAYKNVRSHLWGIQYRLTIEGWQTMAAVQAHGISLVIHPRDPLIALESQQDTAEFSFSLGISDAVNQQQIIVTKRPSHLQQDTAEFSFALGISDAMNQQQFVLTKQQQPLHQDTADIAIQIGIGDAYSQRIWDHNEL